MGFRCGIVGLPNVGKSTLFNALTSAAVDAANFPFCTVEPNTGIVPVPDIRLMQLAKIVDPERVVPTTMTFVDIAGLIAGASEGEGLGNRFLSHIRETDAIAHVVRCFNDDNIMHVAGKISPLDDIEVINTELLLADFESANRSRERLAKSSKSGARDVRAQLLVVERICDLLGDGNPVSAMSLSDEESQIAADFHFLTSKPVMYIANVDEDGLEGSDYLNQVEQIANEEKAVVVPVCTKLEEEIAQLPEGERAEFLESIGLERAGLHRMIYAGYKLLGLHHFFTAGPKEARAWTIPIGTRAPAAAGTIHTDFERGFIRAEVVAYKDFISADGESGARAAGQLRIEGRDYVLEDGDVVHFRFNV